MGLLMQTDFAKSDGMKSDLRIRWPKSVVRFWPKVKRLDPSDYQLKKWRRSFNQVKIYLSRAACYSSSSRYTQKYEYE